MQLHHIKLYLLVLTTLVLSFSALAQQPNPLQFQGVLRTADNRVLRNATQTLNVQVSFSNAVFWEEQHQVKTDANGVFTVTFGAGTNLSSTTGTFEHQLASRALSGSPTVVIRQVNNAGPMVATLKLGTVPKVQHATYSMSLAPRGTIVAFAGDSSMVPPGWVICDGKNYGNFSSLPDYDVGIQNVTFLLGGRWGTASFGSQTTMPDFRGYFPMGVANGDYDKGANVNRFARHPGGAMGSGLATYQKDSISPHTHIIPFTVQQKQISCPPGTPGNQGVLFFPQSITNADAHFAMRQHGVPLDTRPKNVSMLFIMKL